MELFMLSTNYSASMSSYPAPSYKQNSSQPQFGLKMPNGRQVTNGISYTLAGAVFPFLLGGNSALMSGIHNSGSVGTSAAGWVMIGLGGIIKAIEVFTNKNRSNLTV
jgi:hypothetical protein